MFSFNVHLFYSSTDPTFEHCPERPVSATLSIAGRLNLVVESNGRERLKGVLTAVNVSNSVVVVFIHQSVDLNIGAGSL